MASAFRIEATLTLHDYTGEARVEAVHGSEELSRGFHYVVDFQALDLELDALRGTTAAVVLDGPHGQQRVIHGLVAELEVLGVEAARSTQLDSYRVVLVPATHVLGLRHGFRIFQDQSTVEIVTQVFKDAGLPDNMFEWRVGSYAKRTYCVQYDETEWALVCRLLEEEGIWFRFEHAQDGHVMVLQDQSANADAMDPDYLPFEQVGGLQDRLCARELSVHNRARVGKVTLDDCHPDRPGTKLQVSEHDQTAFAREDYEFPSGCFDPARQKVLAKQRLDERRGAALSTTIRCNAFSAASGKRFTLDGHPISSDGEVFVRAMQLQLTLRALDGRENATAARGREAVCEVDLELQPLSLPFRPARITPRPQVLGVQTARVTGPGGQEVYFDDQARVKLQFHWDRQGTLNESSSCWVPVAQGHTTGSLAMPRIGWEVLVEFVDANPDRPICQGRVYNPFYPPPVSLPADKTVSTFRSDSVGGDGYSMLRFDDAAGAEMFQIHAQYDLNAIVGNNEKVQVEQKATWGVGKNREVAIGADDTESFEADRSTAVVGNQKIGIGVNRTTKVNGNATEDTAGNLTRTIAAAETIHVGSLAAAVITQLTHEAIQGAMSAAATAAQRLGAAALGPLMPALAAAREAVGGAAKFAGPAAALLTGGSTTGTALGDSIGLLARADAAVDVSASTAMATAALSGAITPKVLAAARTAASASAAASASTGGGAAGGAGGAGGGAGAGGGGGAAGSGGDGNWTTTVGGNVTETIGALVAITSAQAINHGIGGNRSEVIGAARIEAIKGGRNEDTGAAKGETVGTYTIKTQQDISIQAGKAGVIDIAGALTQKIGGSHTISGAKDTLLKTTKLKLKAKTSVSLICGMAKVVIDGNGVQFAGLKSVTLEASKISMEPVDIGPG